MATLKLKARLLAQSEQQKKAEDEAMKELTAAAALTSLVGSADEEADCEEWDEKESTFDFPQRYTRSGRKRAISFPLKLMKVLSQDCYTDVIAWMPSGKSFTIINSKRFVAEILPQFFKSAKFSSFTRKLHRWGFVRHYRGEEAGAFYHESFQRGRQDLVEAMTCYKQDPPKQDSPKTDLNTRHSDMLASPEHVKPTVVVPTHPPAAPPKQAAVPTPAAMPVLQTPIVGATPGCVAPGLDAAIELEVSRRLRERLEEEAFNRQALAMFREQRLQQRRMMMQQQQVQHQDQQFLMQQQQMLNEQQQQRLKQAFAATLPVNISTQSRWSQQGMNMLKQNVIPLPCYQPGFKPVFSGRSDTQPLPSLPQRNINHAKTA